MSTATLQAPPKQPPANLISKAKRARPLFDPPIVKRAIWDSFVKLSPATLWKNPVMFVVEIGAMLTTLLLARDVVAHVGNPGFALQICLWLWFTVLFANFAEAMAEGRGKAQAESLRKTKTESIARRLVSGKEEQVPASALRKGDVVLCEPGDLIPGDGEVIEGIASVDESVITGESAPVIRESGGDRSAVTGGTKVLSDYIKVQITSNPGETFLDRMIALVEGAQRQKTPNEIALNIMIAGLTLIFLLATVTLAPFAMYSVAAAGAGSAPTVTVLVSLLVCLIPTTIGGLLSAIGIAGMDRVMQHNVLAMSGRAVEAAGTSTRCCWIRREPSRWAIAKRWNSSRATRSQITSWPTQRSFRAWLTRHRKAGRSSCWQKTSTGCAAGRWPATKPNSCPSPRRPA